jgi:hypothetical protein
MTLKINFLGLNLELHELPMQTTSAFAIEPFIRISIGIKNLFLTFKQSRFEKTFKEIIFT